MDGPLSFEAPEELLRQRGWMQALARSILRAPADADDATQEALLAALEHPPAAGRPVRPWLTRVVTNFAYRLRRGEGRRRAREQAAHDPAAPQDPVELFAIQQDVARAVQSLDEPLRATTVLHYFGGLDTPEIARRQGVSAAAVRQRLQRGRARLRADLERHYGGASAFALALARLVEPDASATPGSVPPAAAPGVALAPKLLAAAAAVLSLAVAWTFWSTTSRGIREAEPVQRAASAGAGHSQEPRAASGAAATGHPNEREPLDSERGLEPIESDRAPAGAQRITHGFQVAGEVVDGEGRALPGAEVLVSALYPAWESSAVAARTAAAGRFHLDAVDERQTIVARAPGRAPSIGVWIHALQGAEVPLRIVLDRPGTSVRGRVSDESGRPVGEALVWVGPAGRARMFLDPDEGRRPPPATTRTDARGEFRLEHVPAGAQPFSVQAAGFAPWRSEIEVVEGENVQDVRLAPGASVHGRVLDPSGAALAGVVIEGPRAESNPFRAQTRTDARGEFTLDGLGPGRAVLVASDDGLGRAEAELELAAGRVAEWNAVLDPRARIHGTLRDREGRPLGGWDVRLRRDEDEQSTTTDERGAFGFAGEPASAWRLAVFAPGVVEGYPSLVARDVRPSGEPLALVLPDLAATTGRVVGRAVSADRTGIGAAVASATQWPGDLWCAVPLDADGCFEIARVPPGTIEVQVQSQRCGTVRLGEHEIEAGQELDLGTLRLGEPGRVHGALRGLAPERLAAVRVDLRRADEDLGAQAGVVAGTSYRSPELQPGEYELALQGDFVASLRRSLTVRSGVDLALDLELQPAGMRALVLLLSEPGPSPWVWCHVRDESGESRWFGAGDAADGALELFVSALPGTYRVEAFSEDGDELTGEIEIAGLDGAQPPLVLEFPAR